jgi:hypothetical protein
MQKKASERIKSLVTERLGAEDDAFKMMIKKQKKNKQESGMH